MFRSPRITTPPITRAPASVAAGGAASTIRPARHWRPALEAIAIPTGAVLVACIAFGIFCYIQGKDPLGVFAAIHKAAFGSAYSFQNTLVRAAPLMLTALCTALPARLGLVVIGNEGALVVGGLVSTAAGLAVTAQPGPLLLLVMALGGIAGGGAWMAIVGLLKYLRNVNETISSLLLNYIAIALMNHLVNGIMRDPSSLNKPSSFPIPEEKMIPAIAGSNVHYGLFLGIFACLIAWILMEHTTFGFKVRMVGGNDRAARMSGLAVPRLGVITCVLAGAAAGLAGMVEVAAVHGRANESLSAGYGYAGILVSFVARHRGLPILLVSVLLGGILASGGILQRQFQMPDSTILLFQGFVFLAILFSDSLYGRFDCFKSVSEKREPPSGEGVSAGQEKQPPATPAAGTHGGTIDGSVPSGGRAKEGDRP